MKWFYNMKIAKKLILSFVIVSLLAGVVGIIGITNLSRIDKNYTAMYEEFGTPLDQLGMIGIRFHSARALLRNMLMTDDRNEQQGHLDTINKFDQEYAKSIAIFEQSITTEQAKQDFNQLTSLVNQYISVRDSIIESILAGNKEQAMILLSDAQEITLKTDEAIQNIFTNKSSDGAKVNKNLHESTQSTVLVLVSVVVAAMVTAIGLGIFISRIISNPINRLVHTANRIADGDLNVEVKAESRDEIGMLSEAFGAMTDTLNEVMSNIRSASDQVATGAKQMSESSILLSQGATEQASSVEQLTVSLEEVSTKIKLNTENALQATKVTAKARDNALQGNDRMKEMLTAMDDINASSNNISKIIKVIDEIAFQTNILALNAAVEAARAGQHGKGFAVVAEEVRNLAARSANAAKETTEMIEGSIQKVDGGMKIANETAAALENIVKDITIIAQLAGDTADASTEQSVGVSQINQGLLQVSQVIQTNSATSEESAAASEELTGQAEMLKEQVSRFNLKGQSYSGTYNNYQSSKAYSKFTGSSRHIDEQFAEAAAGMEPLVISDKEFGKY